MGYFERRDRVALGLSTDVTVHMKLRVAPMSARAPSRRLAVQAPSDQMGYAGALLSTADRIPLRPLAHTHRQNHQAQAAGLQRP